MEKLLANNSSNMKTVVETFIVEETATLIYDNEQLDNWNAKVAELGLTGQTKVVKEEKSPIPFLWMNPTLIEILETLCPRKVDITLYDKMPIPVEILEMVALAKRENYFDCMEIWYDDKKQDPACIGYRYAEDNKHDWMNKHYADKYLLGKWSDVKASFSELMQRARTRFISEKQTELKTKIKDAQRELEDLELSADRKFGGEGTVSIDLPF